jgi:hypothetical protein
MLNLLCILLIFKELTFGLCSTGYLLVYVYGTLGNVSQYRTYTSQVNINSDAI